MARTVAAFLDQAATPSFAAMAISTSWLACIIAAFDFNSLQLASSNVLLAASASAFSATTDALPARSALLRPRVSELPLIFAVLAASADLLPWSRPWLPARA